MKKFRKLGGILLAVVIVAVSLFSAMAVDDPNELLKTHSYYAYQIFNAEGYKREASANQNDSIVNVQWGSAFEFTTDQQKADFINGLKSIAPFSAASRLETAEDIAKVLSDPKYGDDSDVAKDFAKYTAKFAINNLTPMSGTYKNGERFTETGYYLFLDATDTDNQEDVVANAVVSKMKANEVININVKVTVPTLEKKVKENTYNSNAASEINKDYGKFEYGNGYNDVADYNIGDKVPFELIGTMAEGMEYYDTYYYGFVDTLCKGLTFDAGKADVKIYVYNPNPNASGEYEYGPTGDELVAAGKFTYTATVNADGTTKVVFECDDILPITEINSKSRIVVKYNAVLNNEAVVGYNGNENKAYLEYSNNPLPTPGGTTPSTPSKGHTPEDKVIVFTYSLDVNKIDKNTGAALDGAEFYLVNSQGEYYCKETGENSLPYWGTATDANVAKITPDATDKAFKVRGLDKGTYKLIEAKAPGKSGEYRKLEAPVVIDVNAVILPDKDHGTDTEEDKVAREAAQNWNDGKAESALLGGYSVSENDSVTPNSNDYVSIDGTKVTVANEKTYVLPGTGGEGTALIYIIGGALLAAAAGLFIVKRRSSK